MAEFRVDAGECSVTFKGPGYAADAFIDREMGGYELTQTLHGFVAVINDLHKGRDTGRAWSAALDASAVVLVVISLTGLGAALHQGRRLARVCSWPGSGRPPSSASSCCSSPDS